jgi:Protein of unknown function (DUF3891)
MMVCPYDDEHLLLVLQVDHSKVTGWFAAHWGNDTFAPLSPYHAMVLAAQEHDTGWWDWEIKPHLNDEGLPPDYIGSIKHLGGRVWLDFYRHGISRLAEQDAYAGYMVSLHSDGLLTQGRGLLSYMPDYTVYPEVKQFLGEQESFRAELMQQLNLGRVSRLCFGRAALDKLQAHGSLRSNGTVCLQPLSIQQYAPKKWTESNIE